jgi:mannose-1-phosphate guanylyltransferase
METFAPWALVLAAGEGTRLRDLTTDPQGNTIPKQYCSLYGGMSLLQLALLRAAQVSPWGQVNTIVAAHHEAWWHRPLAFLPKSNVIVQPRNRGTGIGTLLPLLSILDRDPKARVVLLPSDHFVADERALARAICDALVEVERRPERIVLLGIVPDETDGEFGWIVPVGDGKPGIPRVAHFVEKPPPPEAMNLMAQGALWNSFIFAAEGKTLLDLFDRRIPGAVTDLWEALAQHPRAAQEPDTLADVYERLVTVDFSRDVLEGCVDRLSVVPVPRCGWCDLGTPARVARCVERLAPRATVPPIAAPEIALDLAQVTLQRGRLATA